MSDPLVHSYTPGDVVTQMGTVLNTRRVEPRSVLDPSAGSGVFGQRLRLIWPSASYRAIEIRRQEAWNLRRHYGAVHTGDLAEIGPGWEEKYDLVMTNPRFALWERAVFELLTTRVAVGGLLVLLGLTAWGSRSIGGYELFKEHPPWMQCRIPGTVSFQGTSGSDTRDYCWWVWSKQKAPLKRYRWTTENLERLPPASRRWRLPPGTEPSGAD